MHPSSTPSKHQEAVRFPDVFRGWRKGALGTNGLRDFLISVWIYFSSLLILDTKIVMKNGVGVSFVKFFEVGGWGGVGLKIFRNKGKFENLRGANFLGELTKTKHV